MMTPASTKGRRGRRRAKARTWLACLSLLPVLLSPDAGGAARETLTPLEQATQAAEQAMQAAQQASQAVKRARAGGNTASTEAAMQRLAARLDAIDRNIETLQSRIQADAGAITEQGGRLDPLSRQVGSLAAQVEHNQGQIDRHDGSIQDNSVKLYENLMSLDQVRQSQSELEQRLQRLSWTRTPRPGAAGGELVSGKDTALLPFALGLLLPAGILLFQAGRVGPAQSAAGSAGMLLALAGASLGFALLGLGIRYGDSLGGAFGSPFQYLSSLLELTPAPGLPDIAKALMRQLPLVVGLALLVCTTAAARLSAGGAFLAALLLGGLLLPLFGHWADTGWLSRLGFEHAGEVVGGALVGGSAALGLALGLRERAGSDPGADSILLLPAVGLIWVGWLEPLLLRPIPGTALTLVLGGWVAATGAVLAKAAASALFDAGAGRLQGLAAALLAGVLAVPAAGPDAGVVEEFSLGLLVGGLHGLLAPRLLRRQGAAAELALAFVLAGLAAALAPALIGPRGLLHMPVAEGLPVQLLGAGMAVLLGGGAGMLLGRLLLWLPGLIRRQPAARAA